MPKDNIKKYRDKIDLIDKKILRLIQERASHAVSIGKLKSKISPKSSFYKPDRETKILRNMRPGNLKAVFFISLFFLSKFNKNIDFIELF